VSVPAGNHPVLPVSQSDLNDDALPETLELFGTHLSIVSLGQTVWQSPAGWNVIQAAISDLDHDGHPEVILLVWRPFKAWPVDNWLPNGGRITDFQNSEGQSCHMILVGWKQGGYRELWAGSAMADPVTSFIAADLDGDNTQELAVLESRYADVKTAPAHILKVWEWNGFGFTVVSYKEGLFDQMTPVRASDGRILILVP